MKKYLVFFLTLVILFSLTLTGCSKPEGTTPDNQQTETGQKSGNETASTSEKQTMTAMFLGSSQDQPVVDIIQNMTNKFNADNSYNVEFKFETYENEQYKTKLTTVMAANAAPDVFFTWSAGYLKPFVEGGKVFEIGQLLNADEEWKSRFNDGVFGPVTYDGKIYAVPHGQTVAVMFYNTRLFSEYNVSVPKTFEELKKACETFLSNGIIPISVPVKDAWIAGQILQQIANGVGGMDLFNGTVDGSVKWNEPRYIKAGELLLELVNMNAFQDGYLGMTYDEGRELFAQEKAAMFYMGSWDLSVLSEPSLPVSQNIGVFNLPPNDPGTGNVAIGDVDQCLAISSNCKNSQAAAEYIKMYSDVEAQEAYAYDAKYLLSTKTPLDASKLNPLFIEINNLQQGLTGVTPWLDRVFGAGEGVEFNNAAQAIIAGKNPTEKMNELQQFAEDNALR
jgi:raffinose/stachyose/melibiose transport system substrate-binding protein